MAVVKRAKLVESDVREAKVLARSGAPKDRTEHIWSDTEAKGLRLRVRGNAATWLFKTEINNRAIGDAFATTLAEARDIVT